MLENAKVEKVNKVWEFDGETGKHICYMPNGTILTLSMWDVVTKEVWETLSVGMQTIAIYGQKQIPADRNPKKGFKTESDLAKAMIETWKLIVKGDRKLSGSKITAKKVNDAVIAIMLDNSLTSEQKEKAVKLLMRIDV
jgi:hypothetical protein